MTNLDIFRMKKMLYKDDRKKFQELIDDYKKLKDEQNQKTLVAISPLLKESLKESMDNYIPKVEVDGEGQVDNVNHPKHYEGKIECINAMQEVLDKDGTISFCIGNAFKYIWRCKKKHETPIEDLEKCRWYINKALELLESEEEK